MIKLKNKIAPSLLSADFANLESEVKKCEDAGCDLLHIDVMDGHFVPNITIGPLVVAAIRPHSKLPLDCHLMISNPDKYVPDFAKAGADMISVHVEATHHLHRSLSLIKSFGIKAGIALNPVTPLEYVYSVAEYCDFIMLMSVNPGFGGQSFIPSFLKRAKLIRDFLDREGLQHVELEVDGGVKLDNAREISEAGANILVSGFALFNGDFYQNVKLMKEKIS